MKSAHLAQDVSQTLLHQKGAWDKAGGKGVTQCSGQPESALASASTLPGEQPKDALTLQTGPGGSQH